MLLKNIYICTHTHVDVVFIDVQMSLDQLFNALSPYSLLISCETGFGFLALSS